MNNTTAGTNCTISTSNLCCSDSIATWQRDLNNVTTTTTSIDYSFIANAIQPSNYFNTLYEPKKEEKEEKESKKGIGDLDFVKVEILCPNKVVRFTFGDGKIIKTICDDEDEFDFKFAFFIALAKKRSGSSLTPEGIINEAKQLSYKKFWNKVVNKGIKLYYKEIEEKTKEEAKEKELKEIKQRQAAKKRAKKARARKRRINEMAEAIKKANE